MRVNKTCPCCGGLRVQGFHSLPEVPVNSVLALESKAEALDFPTGEIQLGFCEDCGFIYNMTFDPRLLEYSSRYDPTQAFSETFNKWHRELAQNLVQRLGLSGKKVIEIGCGKGEFLHLLAEVGGVEGVGFDPAYEASRDRGSHHDRLRFVADFYSEKYADVEGDAVCCKMTLEHIGPARQFVETVRRAVGDRPETAVFFQVPDVRRILEEGAFWDVYYEHCSYYSAGSLARLFRTCGFEVREVTREYGDQYLMLLARPDSGPRSAPPVEDSDLASLRDLVSGFADRFTELKHQWEARLADYRSRGLKTVVWGSGSKGVSFLTTFGVDPDIEYVVDINTHRQGHFMARTGQEIVAPGFLVDYAPDVVVVMNPMYRAEIEEDLAGRGLSPAVLTV